jgi:mannose/fructose/N-acetylgalactosamine-specific phosphotransferase system component IID
MKKTYNRKRSIKEQINDNLTFINRTDFILNFIKHNVNSVDEEKVTTTKTA